LLLILGFTNLGRTLLGEKAPSHSYACGELQHGFAPSTEPKVLPHVQAWVHASKATNIIAKQPLHDDEAWRVYLQWYMVRTRMRVTCMPSTEASHHLTGVPRLTGLEHGTTISF
jgi:hypothetical protein